MNFQEIFKSIVCTDQKSLSRQYAGGYIEDGPEHCMTTEEADKLSEEWSKFCREGDKGLNEFEQRWVIGCVFIGFLDRDDSQGGTTRFSFGVDIYMP